MRKEKRLSGYALCACLVFCLLLTGLGTVACSRQPVDLHGYQRSDQVTDTVAIVMKNASEAIIIELRPDKAPITVENFLGYVNSGFYNLTVFHRAIDGFMIQAGAYYTKGYTIYSKPPLYRPIVNEGNNGLSNARGTISTALSNSADSATSQFFINQVDNLHLDHDFPDGNGYGHCVFGTVLEGMDVVDVIAAIPTCYINYSLQSFPCSPPAFIHTAYEMPCTLSYCSDLESAGQIDFEDFAILALHWLDASCDSSNSDCAGADMDNSGNVDLTDMNMLWYHWAQAAGHEPRFSNLFPDDAVDSVDFSLLSARWLYTDCQKDNNYCDGADINRDGSVDFTDFALLMKNWLTILSR